MAARPSKTRGPTEEGVVRSKREQTQAETRERLLAAALRLFAADGYARVSIDRVAEEAGYTKGAFYSNFESKESAFLELLARHMARESAELSAILAGAETPPWNALERWLEGMNADADWSVLSVELGLHARRSPEFANAYRRLDSEHRGRLAELVTALFRAAGRRPTMPAEQVVSLLKALAHGLVLERRELEGRPDPAGPLIGVVLRALIESGSAE
ncbi:MAG: TetR/AcrR family transcriptional regulator [Isosphaeraceae bacterium]|nr:TetR/AcrR family transcriptional regulator [Isosphaeraceae bacterium]